MSKYRVRSYTHDSVACFDAEAETEEEALEQAEKIIPPTYMGKIDFVNFNDPSSSDWEGIYRLEKPWVKGRLWLSSPHDTVEVILTPSQITLISEGLNYYRKFLGRMPIKEIAEKMGLPLDYVMQAGFYMNDKYRRD